MLVRAIRGVCVGVERHLAAGDTADLDPATGNYLIGIGAVEEAKPEPAKPEPAPIDEPPSDSVPVKSGKKEK